MQTLEQKIVEYFHLAHNGNTRHERMIIVKDWLIKHDLQLIIDSGKCKPYQNSTNPLPLDYSPKKLWLLIGEILS